MRKLISALIAFFLSVMLVAAIAPPASAASSPKAPTCNRVLTFMPNEQAKCKARELWTQINYDVTKVAQEKNGAKRAELVAKNYLMVSAPLAKTNQAYWGKAFETHFTTAKSKASGSATEAKRIMIVLRDTVAKNQSKLNQMEAASATLKAMNVLMSKSSGAKYTKFGTKSFIKTTAIPFLKDGYAKDAAFAFFADMTRVLHP